MSSLRDEIRPRSFYFSAGPILVRYARDNLPGKVLARECRLALPDEKRLAKELEKARKNLEQTRTRI